jgi:tricorn protease-like protein
MIQNKKLIIGKVLTPVIVCDNIYFVAAIDSCGKIEH